MGARVSYIKALTDFLMLVLGLMNRLYYLHRFISLNFVFIQVHSFIVFFQYLVFHWHR